MAKEYTATKRSALMGILFCFGILIFITLMSSKTVFTFLGISKDPFALLFTSRLVQWFSLLLIFLYSLKIEKQNFLLWKNHSYKIPFFLLHIVLLYLTVIMTVIPVRMLIAIFELKEHSKQLGIIVSVMKDYPWMILLVCLTAGIVEEFIFRGYLQPRIEAVTKSPFLCIFISALLFGAVHYGYGTLDNVVVPFVVGIVFAVHYWKFRNIYVLMACHTFIDLISVCAMVYR